MKLLSRKLLELEGLRGIAALVVLVSHLRLTFCVDFDNRLQDHLVALPNLLSKFIQSVVEALYDGNFAVWIFWVMSAFVLSLRPLSLTSSTATQALFKKSTSRGTTQPNNTSPFESGIHDYLATASLRRYPRLLIPVIASVLFAYFLHAWGLMYNTKLATFFGPGYQDGWLNLLYQIEPSFGGALKTAVWDTFFSYQHQTSYNTVLWSIEMELYGSFFLFGFLALIGTARWRPLAYLIAWAVIWGLKLHELNAFVAGIVLCDGFLNRNRLVNLLSPGWQSILTRIRQSRGVSFFVLFILLVGIGQPNYYGVMHLLMAVMLAFWVLFSQPIRRILSNPIPVFLGKISFGLYLCHLPLICSLTGWFYLSFMRNANPFIAAGVSSVITLIVSLLVGYAFYRLVDRPSILIAKKFSCSVHAAANRIFPPASKHLAA